MNKRSEAFKEIFAFIVSSDKIKISQSVCNTAAFLILILVITSFLQGCISAVRPGWVEYGTASWYGPDFQGKKTSNGETYNMNDLTAAHQKLPFGTIVKVTYLETGKSVKVRINDRGPFKKGRIIDLSYAAAKIIGLDEEGSGKVRIRVIDTH